MSTGVPAASVVVVVVELDFAEAGAAEGGEGVDVGGFVFVDGEEEGVARGAAVGVCEVGEEAGVLGDPVIDAARGLGGVGAAVPGFIVVGDAEDEVDELG